MSDTHPAYEVLRPVTEAAGVVLADNPSGMTLDGTNSWILRAPGHRGCVVVDPGPDDPTHLERLWEQGPVELVLLTHHHLDHSEAARTFAGLTGAPVRALDPTLCLGAEGLGAGEALGAAGLDIRVLATPGHTTDSLCFVIDGDGSVLTGDTVLGRGTTVLGDHHGALGDYLTSLERLAGLPAGTTLLPGHGPDLPDAPQTARDYLAHREQRLDQVRAALRQLQADPEPRQVVEIVYADVDESLWPAADMSVAAQLEYLRET
ncbi:MBL fold metallo-hydrolase [Actinomycetospora soli]|uniref:MBL fold metallo-hydrolase n=1 Tax=Actinomycetospora soli TaxID=2893887 RepID=UPI001E493890|nr:MBL fold metallo-hydrolase [Actinomycetospora soli]MCD2189912.1 MBL fold metallo-hydrolase [Actinomycetospora soli]